MMKTAIRLLLSAGFCLFLAACASPQKRIEANPERFRSFPPEAREKIRRGEVALGFTPDMVRMAKGDPSAVSVRTTTGGATTVWRYTRPEIHTHVHPVGLTGYGRGVYPGYIETEETRMVETLRVEFEDDEVVAFEEKKE